MATDNSTVGYNGRRTCHNCTVMPPELAKGIAKQKEHSATAIRQYVKEGRRANKPGTKRMLTHNLSEEHYTPEGPITKKVRTSTQRKSN